MNLIYKIKNNIPRKKSKLLYFVAILVGEANDFFIRVRDVFWIIKKSLGIVNLETIDGEKLYGDKICIFALYQKNNIEKKCFPSTGGGY